MPYLSVVILTKTAIKASLKKKRCIVLHTVRYIIRWRHEINVTFYERYCTVNFYVSTNQMWKKRKSLIKETVYSIVGAIVKRM